MGGACGGSALTRTQKFSGWTKTLVGGHYRVASLWNNRVGSPEPDAHANSSHFLSGELGPVFRFAGGVSTTYVSEAFPGLLWGMDVSEGQQRAQRVREFAVELVSQQNGQWF